MCVLTIDLETTTHNVGNGSVGSFSANPHSPKNFIVWAGIKRGEEPTTCVRTTDVKAPKRNDIVVVHNAHFDIPMLCNPNNKFWKDWLEWVKAPTSRLWDTMVMEYILSGHYYNSNALTPKPRRVGLDACAARYGLPLKDESKFKAYLKEGIPVEDIPEKDIVPYCVQDVNNTYAIFQKQLAEGKKQGCMKRLRLNGDAELTTIEMALNGQHFDRSGALSYLETEILPKLEEANQIVPQVMSEMLGIPVEHVNPNSTEQIKVLIHGGAVKYDIKEPKRDASGLPVVYKSGPNKGKVWMVKGTREVSVQPLPELPQRVREMGNADKTVLNELRGIADQLPGDFIRFLDALETVRKMTKLKSTYFEGYSNMVWSDGKIRGSFNHATTVTGRLSSSNPNLQNVGHSPIRKFFKSRFDGGVLMEADLSQIEVVYQAFLSQDDQMIQDILDGIDFHSVRAAYAAGAEYEDVLAKVEEEDPVWVKRRKSAKTVSFQKAYGAGIKKVAFTLNMPESEVKKIFNAEDTRYPGVVQMKRDWYDQVEHSAEWTEDGECFGYYPNMFGGSFRFFKETSYKGDLQFGYTKVINYPIQGGCAEILKLFLRETRNALRQWFPEAVLVNTVHDSIIIDCPSVDYAKDLGAFLQSVIAQLPEIIEKEFGFKFNLPIKGDIDVGYDWYDMKGVAKWIS